MADDINVTDSLHAEVCQPWPFSPPDGISYNHGQNSQPPLVDPPGIVAYAPGNMFETSVNEHTLAIGDGPSIIESFNNLGLRLSEYSFPNLYLFRDTHKYSVLAGQHGIIISGITRDERSYLMPATDLAGAPESYLDHLKHLLESGRWDFLFPIPEQWVHRFSEDIYTVTCNEDESDYLLHTEKMKTYPGKKMHKKKNLLNQFLREHTPASGPITAETLGAAIEILDIWQETTPQELETSDYNQTREALELRDELGLTHAMYFADGKPLGFIIGEPLNDDTFAIHLAKADIQFKGAYQYLFSAFASEHCSGHHYMNLEQDMGIEGLRKTKLSYRPDLMVRKYRVGLRR